MTPLTLQGKRNILSRLFWDKKTSHTDLDKVLEENFQNIEVLESQQFFARLLTSCDWYTLLRLMPCDKLKLILTDSILNKLFPKDLKHKFVYARAILSQ